MFRKLELYCGNFELEGGRWCAARMKRDKVAGHDLKLANEHRTFCSFRCGQGAGLRTIQTGIVARVTQNAALFIGANMPMHDGCKRGDGKYRHHQHDAETLPTPAFVYHSGHHTPMATADTMLLYSRRRFPMKLAGVFMAVACAGLAILVFGCSPDAAKAAALSPNYSAAQEALAVDDFEKAKVALTALAGESTGDFQKEIQTAATAADIESMRLAFRSASDILIKNGVPAQYAVAYCPMYKGGASWVQKKGSIVNPYTGKSMPGCGVFKE